MDNINNIFRFTLKFFINYVFFTAPIAIAMAISLSIGADEISVRAILIIWVSLISSSMMGYSIVHTYLKDNIHPSVRISSEILIGIFTLSAMMLFLCLVLTVSAAFAFFMVCGAGLIATIFNARHWTGVNVDFKSDCGAIAFVSALSMIWSWQAIHASQKLFHDYIFHAWPDFFFHSAMITQFAWFSDFDGTWIYASGTRIPVYHYANYMLPAAINALSDVPALTLATAFTEPFSFIVMGLSVWVLGTVIVGRAGGAAAIAAVMMLPSAAHYWFRNPYYDFHWLLQITPMAYSIGLSLLTAALWVIALEKRSAAACWLAFALTLISAFFKIQVFALLLLSSVCMVTVFWRPQNVWFRKTSLIALGIFGAISIGVAELLPRAPHFLSTAWKPHAAVKAMLGTSYVNALHGVFYTPLHLLILMVTAFGLLIPTYITCIIYLKKINILNSFDYIPLIVLATYCAIILSFPLNTSDEFHHRPFVLVYAIFAVWCACLIVRLVGTGCPKYGYSALIAIGVALTPVPFYLQKSAQSGGADWMKAAARNVMPQGLLECAQYIRQNSAPSEITLHGGDDGDVPFYGNLVAVSERASYAMMLRSDLAWTLWGTPLATIRDREAVNQKLLHTRDFKEFSETAKKYGINWYVLAPTDRLSDGILRNAVIVRQGYHLFHIEHHLPAL